MNRAAASGTLLVLPVPDSRPPVRPADEIFAASGAAVLQEGLALDFDADDEVFAHQSTRRLQLPDPVPVVGALAQAFVEVMSGLRPPAQVSRWAAPEVYAVLSRRSVVATRRGPTPRRPAVVRRVVVQEPADGVAEACAVVVHHDRVRAVALRLTGLDGRWIVTRLSIG